MSIAKGTLVATEEGWMPVEDVPGSEHVVSEGTPQEITFVPANGKNNVSTSVVASRLQEWVLTGYPYSTFDIRTGDMVDAYFRDFGFDHKMWANGFLFGLGKTYATALSSLPDDLERFYGRLAATEFEEKPFLPVNRSAKEKGSWISGLYDSTGGLFKCVDSDTMDWVVSHLPFGGKVASGPVHYRQRVVKERGIIKGWIKTYEVHIANSRGFSWKVQSIKPLRDDFPEMYSLPEGQRFILEQCLPIGRQELY